MMSKLNEKFSAAWQGFNQGNWQKDVDVRDFIQHNYTPYEGDESFLAGATKATDIAKRLNFDYIICFKNRSSRLQPISIFLRFA